MLRRNIPAAVLFCTLLIALPGLPAQESTRRSGNGPESAAYEIVEVQYFITGRTRQWALEDVLTLREGLRFFTADELESFLKNQQQLLRNERVLQSARIEYEASDASAGSPQPVHVRVYTEDTWNVLALPYFKYDSNSGLLLSLRGRDYNFLGTIEELAVNLDYELTEDKKNVWGFDTELSLPFRMYSRDWRWALSQKLYVEPNQEVEWEAETSLAYYFSTLVDWSIAYVQGYDLDTGDDEDSPAGQYLTSGVRLGTEIGTGLMIPRFGELTYNPESYALLQYSPFARLKPEEYGTLLGLEQELSAERVDWMGNFRQGVGLSISNENDYRVSTGKWERTIKASLYGYLPREPFALSGRLMGRADLDEIDDDAAEPVRGVLNDRMAGHYGAFWNSDLTLRVFRLGNFVEGYGSIFYDGGVVKERNEAFDPKEDFKQGVGIEAIGFPLFARSFYVRASLGFDLGGVLREGSIAKSQHREIFVGLGHHY